MANSLVDPHTLVSPAYLMFRSAGFTEERAIAVLTRTADKERDEQARQARVVAEAQAERDQELDVEEVANQGREREKQEAEFRRDERKKNPYKYVSIPDRPTPGSGLVLASPYAIRRLEEGEYVELYYYTNAGLLAATAAVTQVGDALAMRTVNEDGTTSWVPATVTPDSELTWEQFQEAVPRFIVAMKEARWAEERVIMLSKFWEKLQVHRFGRQWCPDPIDIRALITYQAEQRQRWHLAIHAPQGAWNISILSQEILRETHDRAYREDRAVKDAESDAS
ncbi:hypothetical protein EVJ58_g520 [Rhodofomes roseus]|uniref:Uncharacterized protein n=1 Tax=Rhodofomes roseus TaxID=34475 RepID=A0A4Y9Z5D9_9APHY|nr:hypothetical protein EVJ58_g520 [Rhodofomes roseus]